MLIKSLEIYSR